MRKRIVSREPLSQKNAAIPDDQWLDLAALAVVEVTSESPLHPIEAAIVPDRSEGWRAEGGGAQSIRLIFDEPRSLKRILLVFEEDRHPLSHEFALSWSPAGSEQSSEIVRQQWNFSPPDSIREVEDYRLDLSNVKTLDLVITPRGNSGEAAACLKRLRIA